MDEHNLPPGWGDDDFLFGDENDEEGEASPWATASATAASDPAENAGEPINPQETTARTVSLKEKAHSIAASVSAIKSMKDEECSQPAKADEIEVSPSDTTHDTFGFNAGEMDPQEQFLDEENYEPNETHKSCSDKTVGTSSRHNSNPQVVIGIVVGLSVCLLFAGGLFGGMYLLKNKEKDISQGQQSRSENEKLESTSDPGSNVTTTSSSDMFQSPASTTSESKDTTANDSESTIGTEVQTTTNIIFYEMYESASLRALEDFMLVNSFNDSVMYGLCDINADGVLELLINYATEADDMTSMYIFFETDYRQAVSFSGSAEICAAQHLIQSFGYGGASVRKIFEMDARGNISSKDELYEEYIGVDTMYYALNGIEIGKAQYDELNEYYDSLKWEYVCNTEYRRSSVETPSDSTKDPYAAIKQEILDSVDNEYYRGGNSHLENAPADMVFYAAADRIWIDIPNAEILEGPDVNYASCIAYTSSFQLIGENTNWYYVMWTEGAGAFTHPCYGFIRKVV